MTPALSFEAFHLTETVVSVFPVTENPVGMEGGNLSPRRLPSTERYDETARCCLPPVGETPRSTLPLAWAASTADAQAFGVNRLAFSVATTRSCPAEEGVCAAS